MFFLSLTLRNARKLEKFGKLFFGGPGDGSPKIWGGRGDGPCIRPPIFCIRSPQCNREKFKGKMTKKVVRNSENVDIFGGPRTETKFVKWSATRKRLRTAGLGLV